MTSHTNEYPALYAATRRKSVHMNVQQLKDKCTENCLVYFKNYHSKGPTTDPHAHTHTQIYVWQTVGGGNIRIRTKKETKDFNYMHDLKHHHHHHHRIH